MAIVGRKRSVTGSSSPERVALPVGDLDPLPIGDLLSLLERLSDEIDALFTDLGVRREPSRNRESSRRA
jgi:hypothetical protein